MQLWRARDEVTTHHPRTSSKADPARRRATRSERPSPTRPRAGRGCLGAGRTRFVKSRLLEAGCWERRAGHEPTAVSGSQLVSSSAQASPMRRGLSASARRAFPAAASARWAFSAGSRRPGLPTASRPYPGGRGPVVACSAEPSGRSGCCPTIDTPDRHGLALVRGSGWLAEVDDDQVREPVMTRPQPVWWGRPGSVCTWAGTRGTPNCPEPVEPDRPWPWGQIGSDHWRQPGGSARPGGFTRTTSGRWYGRRQSGRAVEWPVGGCWQAPSGLLSGDCGWFA